LLFGNRNFKVYFSIKQKDEMRKKSAKLGALSLLTMWIANPVAAQQRVEIAVGEDILETYVGEYEFAPGVALVVTLEDGDLFAQVAGQVRAPIFAESETKFFYRGVDAQVTFTKDASGAVTGLILHQDGVPDQPAPKVRSELPAATDVVEIRGDVALRGDVENELGPIEEAFRSAPDNDDNRRAYADILFRLGNIWQADDVIAPLATVSSSNLDDLRLGARIALMMSDYDRAESLFGRMRHVADADSEAHIQAIQGLVMVYYQSNEYDKARTLGLDGDERRSTLLTFMERFEGEPYQIEWATPERVAHLPIINDFTRPGALPLMELEINGHTVEFILDSGGDRLYIDEAVAERVGIRNIAERRSRYAYTGGASVDEPLGVAETVTMGEVTLKNVPVIVAKWKAMGQTTDGVVTTQMLKQFLSTVDYTNSRITFRERNDTGLRQLLESFGDDRPHQMPFFMSATHLMYTKGSLNGHEGMNMFMDSGLASSMPLVILNETVEFLALPRNDLPGTNYYWSPVNSHGIGSLLRGAGQALGNVLVEENSYWRQGFIFDALISHQYLRHLGSWTIDFDTMTYYFPG